MKITIKQKIILILIISSAIFTAYQKIERNFKSKDDLEIHFIDVGQGDSTLIITPDNKTVLIDAGDEKSSARTVNYIYSQGIEKLDLVIATHPDADHIGGMDKIIKNFDIGIFSMPEVSKDTKQYFEIKEELANKNIKNTLLYSGDRIKIDEKTDFDILSPQKGKNYEDSNEYSIVTKIYYGNISFLLMADASMQNEIEIINEFGDIESDLLKLGHHGSSTSSSEYFFKKVNPSIAVISCGKNNKYGHPHKEVINLINKYNTQLFRTDIHGDIVMISDGNTIKVK